MSEDTVSVNPSALLMSQFPPSSIFSLSHLRLCTFKLLSVCWNEENQTVVRQAGGDRAVCTWGVQAEVSLVKTIIRASVSELCPPVEGRRS